MPLLFKGINIRDESGSRDERKIEIGRFEMQESSNFEISAATKCCQLDIHPAWIDHDGILLRDKPLRGGPG